MADYEPISYWKLIFSAAISLNFVLSKCLVNWSTIIGSFKPVWRGLLNSSGRGKRLFSSPVWTLSELRRLSHRYKTKNSLKLGMTGAVMSPMLGCGTAVRKWRLLSTTMTNLFLYWHLQSHHQGLHPMPMHSKNFFLDRSVWHWRQSNGSNSSSSRHTGWW